MTYEEVVKDLEAAMENDLGLEEPEDPGERTIDRNKIICMNILGVNDFLAAVQMSQQ